MRTHRERAEFGCIRFGEGRCGACVRTHRERAEFGCIRFGKGRCGAFVRTRRERAENAQRTRRVWLH